MQTAAPAAKRQKTSSGPKRVLLVDDFHLGDIHLKPIVKNSYCTLVPLTCTSEEKRSVLVQMSGGGFIPVAFGIDDRENDGRRKVNLSLQVDSESDHEQLQRLGAELKNTVNAKWQSWYPEHEGTSSSGVCHPLVSERKQKNNSQDCWPGISKAAILPNDCASGACKIVNRDTGAVVPFSDLPGMSWHKAVFELRYIYIQTTQAYGIAKKLRYLSCTEGEERCEVVPI
jgi:hypothetical protein